MARYHYTLPNDLAGLYDDLLAALPALRPQLAATGLAVAVAAIEGSGNDIWLTVPDAISKASIDAVVAAHDPLQRTRVQQAAQQARDDEETTLRNYLASATPNPVLVALIRRVVG